MFKARVQLKQTQKYTFINPKGLLKYKFGNEKTSMERGDMIF